MKRAHDKSNSIEVINLHLWPSFPPSPLNLVLSFLIRRFKCIRGPQTHSLWPAASWTRSGLVCPRGAVQAVLVQSLKCLSCPEWRARGREEPLFAVPLAEKSRDFFTEGGEEERKEGSKRASKNRLNRNSGAVCQSDFNVRASCQRHRGRKEDGLVVNATPQSIVSLCLTSAPTCRQKQNVDSNSNQWPRKRRRARAA